MPNSTWLNTVDEVLAHLPDGVVCIDATQTIIYFNDTAETIFGFRRNEILGRPLDKLLPEEYRASHRGHADRFMHEGSSGKYMNQRGQIRGRRKDGSTFPAEASIIKSRMQDGVVTTAIVRDISERRAAEKALAESEELHRAVLAASPDAILMADADTGMIVGANESAGRLFKCRPEDLVGRHQTELHPPEDREAYARYFREHLFDNRIFVSDAEIRTVDGATVPVEIAARPAIIGGNFMAVGVFRDITQRKAQQKAILTAMTKAEAANQAKTLFLSNINHEFRTPLNGIAGMSQVIAHQMFGPVGHEKYVEYARDIQTCADHLSALVNDLLCVSSIELGRHQLNEEVFNIGSVIEECLRMVAPAATESSVDILHRQVDDDPFVLADRRHVRQMVLNVLSNAVKFSPEQGIVGVCTTVDPDRGVVIAISDTGPGFPEELRGQIGQPFITTGEQYLNNRRGFGLGLAITKGLIARHGGEIAVQRNKNGGTVIELVLPSERLRGGRDAPAR